MDVITRGELPAPFKQMADHKSSEQVVLLTLGLFALLAFLSAGCSGMSPEVEAEVRQSFGVSAEMPMKDLGVVKLREGIPKRLRVCKGNYCTFTATTVTNAKIKLDIFFELGMKGNNPTRTETDQWVFRPPTGKVWRLCLLPKGENLAVAIQPILLQ